jgi:hypothetical protein
MKQQLGVLQTHTTDTHYRHALQTHTTGTFPFISHTTNVPLFKFRCNIFIAGFGSEWDTLYLPQHFFVNKIEGTGNQGRRRRLLLDDLEEI